MIASACEQQLMISWAWLSYFNVCAAWYDGRPMPMARVGVIAGSVELISADRTVIG